MQRREQPAPTHGRPIMGKAYETYDPGRTFPGTWDGDGDVPANVAKSVAAAVKYARACGMVSGNGQPGGVDAEGNKHNATRIPNLVRRHVPGAAEAFSGPGTRAKILAITRAASAKAAKADNAAKAKAAKAAKADATPDVPAEVVEALSKAGMTPEQVAAMAQALAAVAK